MDDLARTFGDAHTTAHAFFLVHDRQVIHHFDGVDRASARANTARNTTGRADLHDLLALIMRRAHDLCNRIRRLQRNELLRTSLYTASARGAGLLVHVCQAVEYVNSIKLTRFNTATQTIATEFTATASAAHDSGGMAILRAGVVRFDRSGLAVAGAMHKRHLALGMTGLHTHDLGNFFGTFFGNNICTR